MNRRTPSTRWLFTPTRLVLLLVLASQLANSPSALAANPIQAENALAGTSAWELPGTTPTHLGASSPHIAGYAELSLEPGQVLHMRISTAPSAGYRVEIYRLGWYQGLGGRLVTCRPSCSGSSAGTQQAVPAPYPRNGYLNADWHVTDQVTVGASWTSGYYVAKLILTSGPNKGGASYIFFIVRSTPARVAPILLQVPVNTFEAYNNWGGKSLYGFNSSSSAVHDSGTNAASEVSFNRPFATAPLQWDFSLVRYLERNGYDVSYQADTDTDASPGSLLGHRLDVVAGHDEYWTKSLRDAWEAARDHGVNLAFVGANIGFWQMRYADAARSAILEYRSATLDPDPDPAQKTVQFKRLATPRPECQLLGIDYQNGEVQSGDAPRSYGVPAEAASNGWFAGTGLVAGSTIANSVGYEWDTVDSRCAIPSLQVLLHWSGAPVNADAVSYRAPSGARVFSDGSLQLATQLDSFGHTQPADARVQRLYSNILNDLGGAPGAVPPPPGTPPTPSLQLRSPASGAPIWTPRPLFRWLSSGSVTSFILSVDGRRVGSTTHTTYRFPRDLADGSHTWTVTALGSSGKPAATASRGFSVRSVRPVAHSHRYTLRHGFAVLVFCAASCTARVTLGFGRQRISGGGRLRKTGVARIIVRLSPTFRQSLIRSRSAVLSGTVRTRSGRTRRTVSFVVRW